MRIRLIVCQGRAPAADSALMLRKRLHAAPDKRSRAPDRRRLDSELVTRRVAGGRLWTVYAAERSDGVYLVIDVSGVAAMLSAADRKQLGAPVEVLRFDDAAARDRYARERRWI